MYPKEGGKPILLEEFSTNSRGSIFSLNLNSKPHFLNLSLSQKPFSSSMLKIKGMEYPMTLLEIDGSSWKDGKT